MATKPTTTKERVSKIEDEIGCINDRMEQLLNLIKMWGVKSEPITSIKPLDTHIELNSGNGLIPEFNSTYTRKLEDVPMTFKKPIMYLYNMTGVTVPVTVDFGSMVLSDAIPEIRDDGKITFTLDSDSFINNKYKYLYYEIEYDIN